MSKENLSIYRLVLIGDSEVGKTAITIQYFQNFFTEEYDPTIEDIYVKKITIDGKICEVDVIDTAGQEEYNILCEEYIRSGDGFLIVYSVTDAESFARAINLHKQILQIKNTKSCPMLLIANKIDLRHLRTISRKQGKELANELKIKYYETSAKEGNIDFIFQRVTSF